jgi:hypothetical protein
MAAGELYSRVTMSSFEGWRGDNDWKSKDGLGSPPLRLKETLVTALELRLK